MCFRVAQTVLDWQMHPLKNAEPLPEESGRGLACSQGITNCIFVLIHQ